MKEKANWKRGICWDFKQKDNSLWFPLANKYGICRVVLNERKAEIVEILKEEIKTEQLQYSEVIILDNILVLCPFGANEIILYDIGQQDLRYISLNDIFPNDFIYGKFANAFGWGEWIYLFGFYYPIVVKVNIKTEEVRCVTDFGEENCKDGIPFFSYGHFIKNEKAYIPIGCKGGIFELDLSLDCGRMIYLECNLDGVCVLSTSNDKEIWLVGNRDRQNILIKWNMIDNIYQQWKIPCKCEDVRYSFHKITCLENKIILWPFQADNIYCFDILSETISILEWPGVNEKWQFSIFPYATTLSPVKIFNDILFISGKNYKWYTLNLEDFVISEFVIDWELSAVQYLEKKVKARNPSIVMEEEADLKIFMEMKKAEDEIRKWENGIGKKIYNLL